MIERLTSSLAAQAQPVRGARVLLYGLSGPGFPGGDGALEAERVLPQAGIECVYTHLKDPNLNAKIAEEYDATIVTNTRIAMLQKAPRRLWDCGSRTALWFWDLRPGSVGAPLRGRVDHVFLSYRGPWEAPGGTPYAPEQWERLLDCPVGYCPQGSPLRPSNPVDRDAPRVVFVGDLANKTYHRGRAAIARALGARVINSRHRDGRLAIEARMPELYPSSRYCLSMSPLAPAYTSVRTYSILACGGLLLLHRFPEADRLFEHGRHALLFDSPDEARELLEAYDEADEARAAIARAGRELHAERHTVAHRVVSMTRRMLGVSNGFEAWL